MYHCRDLDLDLRGLLPVICDDPIVKKGIGSCSASANSHMFNCSSLGSWSKRLRGLLASWCCGRLSPCIASKDGVRIG